MREDVSDPATYALVTPIKVAGKETATLSVRPLNGGDLRAMAGRDADGHELTEEAKMYVAIQRCAGLTQREFDALGVADIRGLIEVVKSFLPDGRPTGGGA